MSLGIPDFRSCVLLKCLSNLLKHFSPCFNVDLNGKKLCIRDPIFNLISEVKGVH